MIEWSLIGRCAYDWYIADTERLNARSQRATARRSHLCKNERDVGYGHIEPCLCCYDGSLKPQDWCDNCKYVQGFYLAYQEAAKKARMLRNRLTRYNKAKMKEASE